MHTAHTEQRVGKQWAGAREGDGHCTRIKLEPGPTSWWESSRTGTLLLTTCALECQGLLQEKVGGRRDGEQAGSVPIPTDTSRLL